MRVNIMKLLRAYKFMWDRYLLQNWVLLFKCDVEKPDVRLKCDKFECALEYAGTLLVFLRQKSIDNFDF